MIKNITLIALILMRVFYQPSTTNENAPAFVSPMPASLSTVPFSPAKVVSLNGSISKNKVVLQWIVSENESAAQFEVEKSYDRNHFIMTALVFGTDKTDSDSYFFYEKKGKSNVQYRIKIINKDQTIGYSSVIDINEAYNFIK